MLKTMLLPLLGWILLINISTSPLYAEGNHNRPSLITGLRTRSLENRYKISICCLFKNEAKFLREWIEYHRIVGVDHFYLYNNASIDNCLEVLLPYIHQGVVTLIYWPDFLPRHLRDNNTLWALSTQVPAYQHAAKFMAVNDTEWLVNLDVDEFLVPIKSKSIREAIEQHCQNPGIQIACEFYNASRDDGTPRKKLIIETVELTTAPQIPIEKGIEKLIFKPALHTMFLWPPYLCKFQDNKPTKKAYKSELRINKYLNRPKNVLNFGKIKDKLRIDNRSLSDEETFFLLREGFEIEDQDRPIFRFLPELMKRLGMDSEWGW